MFCATFRKTFSKLRTEYKTEWVLTVPKNRTNIAAKKILKNGPFVKILAKV